MIYEQLQKDKLKEGANRALLSLIMSEICTDGKPMDDKEAMKTLVILRKNSQKTIQLIVRKGSHGAHGVGFTEEKDRRAYVEEIAFYNLLEQYIPRGPNENDIENALAIINMGRTMKSMGALMAYLKAQYEVVDGNLVKSILTGEK
jgi:uncharacterized protein YqeY